MSGSKPGDTASAKRARNAVAVAAVADVVADDRGFVAVEDDEVAPVRILQRLRRGGARFLVPAPCRG